MSRTARAIIASISAGLAMSATIAVAVPPDAAISAVTASALLPFTSDTTTLPPRCAKPIAVARPMPEPAPVTRQTLPSKRIEFPPCQFLPGSIVWMTSKPSNSGWPRYRLRLPPASLCARRNASERVQASKSPRLRQIVCDEYST